MSSSCSQMDTSQDAEADGEGSISDVPTVSERQAQIIRKEQHVIMTEAAKVASAAKADRQAPDQPTIIELQANWQHSVAKKAYCTALKVEEQERKMRVARRIHLAVPATVPNSRSNASGTERKGSSSSWRPPGSRSSCSSKVVTVPDGDVATSSSYLHPSHPLRRADELNDDDFELMDRKGRLPGEPGYQRPARLPHLLGPLLEEDEDVFPSSESFKESSLSTGAETTSERSLAFTGDGTPSALAKAAGPSLYIPQGVDSASFVTAQDTTSDGTGSTYAKSCASSSSLSRGAPCPTRSTPSGLPMLDARKASDGDGATHSADNLLSPPTFTTTSCSSNSSRSFTSHIPPPLIGQRQSSKMSKAKRSTEDATLSSLDLRTTSSSKSSLPSQSHSTETKTKKPPTGFPRNESPPEDADGPQRKAEPRFMKRLLSVLRKKEDRSDPTAANEKCHTE